MQLMSCIFFLFIKHKLEPNENNNNNNYIYKNDAHSLIIIIIFHSFLRFFSYCVRVFEREREQKNLFFIFLANKIWSLIDFLLIFFFFFFFSF